MQRPGIGPITASALLTSIGNGHDLKNGRKDRRPDRTDPRGHITKAGDPYVRSLPVLGARAVLNSIDDKQDSFSRWARGLAERRGY